jgi:subfamily B ATP-binding cassette protein MsbA
MISFARQWLTMARQLSLSLHSVAFMFVLNIVSIVFEGMAVGVLLPIFELLRTGASVDSPALKGRHWQILREISATTGIPLNLGVLLAISFAFILLRQFINYYRVRNEAYVKRDTVNAIRQRALNGFLRARTDVQDRAAIGEIANNMISDLSRALSSLFSVVSTLGKVIQISIYLAGLFVLSAPTTFVSLGLIAFAVFLGRNLMAEIKQTGAAISSGNIQMTSFVVERLKHARLIRLSGTEKAEAKAFAKLSRRLTDQTMHQDLVATRMTLLPEPILLGFAYLTVFVGAGVLGLNLATLGIFVLVLARLLPILRSMVGDYNKIAGKWASAQKLVRYLATMEEAHEVRGGTKVFHQLDQEIRFDRVTFNYDKKRVPALWDVSVAIPAKRMTGLVGPSGAGKSTFVDLLPRLRDPQTGSILFDGVPISEFTTESLRAGISFVPQQPQIFNSTAAEHIRYGKEDASDEEVREAARLAGALPVIEALPEGFDTLLGDGGARLSGGQRQRLDIARALVRRAPILILDEPTSALDADAEAAFRDALQTLKRETDLTIIVIAHRLSTIADAEQIIVLRNGKVDAVGPHNELIEGGGWYARAYRSQVGAHDHFDADSAAENDARQTSGVV